ncbi:VCBS repeat-containing protein [Kribbella sp. NPDC051770]|uniref:FG-GAP repeat domain-containing protein n=1 Tax=Kribbella sp. NPDC051770 TaxID=3155413 RepID=UPI00341EDA9D
MKKLLAGLAGAAVLAATLSTAPAAVAVPPTPTFPAAIDPYMAAPAPGCDPTAKAGPVSLQAMLDAEYPGQNSMGITRPCAVGAPSDHHDGRALDFGFNAGNATQLAKANELLNWMLATDQYGNKHAIARRLGIVYLIWNHKIWSASRASEGWRAYSGPNPHTDHIHFSFSWPGARKQTTWWTSGGVAPKAAESVNGDKYDDLLAVDPDNTLRIYPGNATGTFGGSADIGPGWSSYYNRIGVGDSNADGAADIFATSTDGKLHYWHNSGHGTFTKLANSGTGWNTLEWFTVVDLNKDNKADIVGRDGGFLYWYPGQGNGDFGQRIKIGEGWANMEFAGGDADGDGDGDLWATDAAGNLFFYRGAGNGTFATRVDVGGGWTGFGPMNAMDVNGDGKADLVAVKQSDGHLFRWTGKGTGALNTGQDVGQGWTNYRPAMF